MNEILGVDLSNWRPHIYEPELDRLFNDGCRFLGTRLSLGDDYHDPTANRYLLKAVEHGMVSYDYHFLDKEDGVGGLIDGAAQAENYLRALDALSPAARDRLDGHFLDVEESGIQWSHIVTFMERVGREGIRPGLYSSERIMARYDDYDWRGMFDSFWWAYYTGRRWLSNDRWMTTPEDEADRPPNTNGLNSIWQFGPLRFTMDANEQHAVDGNVFLGTQQQLLDVLKGHG